MPPISCRRGGTTSRSTRWGSLWRDIAMVTHVVTKQLHDEGGDAAVDANQDVDAGEDHVGRAGDLEEEGGRVHQGGDGPAANTDRLAREGPGAELRQPQHPPVEQQQEGERGKVGGRHVGVLLETDEDEDHQGRRDTVVTLQGHQEQQLARQLACGGTA